MYLPKYEVISFGDLAIFEFNSIGKNGVIPKIVSFTQINVIDGYKVYNLAFGDKDIVTGGINDKVISNNGDSDKVLATVVSTIYTFTNSNPKVYIYVVGSTSSRTRLYRMGITKYYHHIIRDFELYGLLPDKKWVKFNKGIEYDAFLIIKK